jgi:hypothetical protein
MSFRITGLPAEEFAPLFALSNEDLAACGGLRQIADARMPGYRCRVSLTDAAEGDEMLLLNYEHHAVDTPYRMRYAIFVRKDEKTCDHVDEVPEQLRSRMLAVRAFDRAAMIVSCSLADGRELEATIKKQLANPLADYLHIHFAAAGCYAARVVQA